MGRCKINMAKIDNLHARQICFSKRRKGLFRKATELCNQGGGEIAVVIFSSAGNLYCYGWPSIDSVVQRYFKHRFASVAAAVSGDDGGKNHDTGSLAAVGRQHGEEGGGKSWWDVPMEDLELHELVLLHAMLGELKEKAAKRASWLLGRRSAEASPDQPSQVFGQSYSKQGMDASSSNSQVCLELSLMPPC